MLENFTEELKNFKQVCPIEMLDKLDNPISLRTHQESRLMSKIKIFCFGFGQVAENFINKLIDEKKILK